MRAGWHDVRAGTQGGFGAQSSRTASGVGAGI